MTYPEAIEFDCQTCTSTLEVPFSFLGASGPCPYCGGDARAPTFEEWEQQQFPSSIPAEVLQRTKVRKRVPKPVEPAVPPSTEALATEKMLNPDPNSRQRIEGRLAKIRERFRRTRLPRIDDSGPSLPQLLGWGTVGLALVATGFGLAVAFYSVPLKAAPKTFNVPMDLTAQVVQEKARQEKLRSQAMNEAQDAVAQFLHSGSAQGGKLSMLSLSGRPAEFSGNIFPDLKRENLAATSCTRVSGSEDYLIIVEPTDERGPVFIVQQEQGKLLLHADALTQQANDALNAFLSAPGEASLVAYVLARPSQTQLPVAGLETWPKVDITPSFPSDHPRAFVASAQPDSATAEAIVNRAGTLHFNKAVAEFKWSKTTQGKRFIELVRVIPSAWGRF